MLELEGNKQAAVSEKVDQQNQRERQLFAGQQSGDAGCQVVIILLPSLLDGMAMLMLTLTLEVSERREWTGPGGGASPALLPNHGELLERPASNVLASITSTHHPAQLQLSPGHALTAILCTSVSPC
ncbi:hypothetical protein TRV_05847 [Trichophyton verrucosum HKI 0517]|uniref:Uncharacterized protein n=1 Tax=Trichophyton verrucosum (strain HKI 0517) TaxID=663202 RepID=D4DFA1_TRIVH|nr:uncharacterized protein TRV_05847 [Trichophyton verrucosum HKI 0517]EFE39450.1 hypothetical protein TRV_05847 [Trichophyton verrucosum HKI 0517]